MPEDSTEATDHLLSNRTYDRLKTLALVLIPALAAAYVGLAGIWSLPNAQEVSGTAVVLVTFLGALIKIGDATYNRSEAKYDGEILVNADNLVTRIVQNGDIPDDTKEILLKVGSDEREDF